MLRYYVLIAVSLFLTGTYSFLFNSERSITSMLFTTVAMAFPAAVGFLFFDYSLTINSKHHLMKYYYAVVIAVFLSYLPITESFPYIELIRLSLGFILGISTVAIIVAFFMYAFSSKSAQAGDVNHAMHLIADEYQRRKEKNQTWEEQVYELFEEKFNLWREKRGKQTA